MDVREYAAIKGITTEEAAREMGEQYQTEPAGFGHNSGMQVASPDASALTMAARDKLRQIVAKVNTLDEERKEVAGQIKDVYAEAKSMGYDTKTLRKVIREMSMDRQEREEMEAIMDVYRLALDMKD